MNDYERITKAISYIGTHFHEQPDLEKVAGEVHLSPFHFQRMFRKWAGVSPKKFLEYICIEGVRFVAGQNGFGSKRASHLICGEIIL